MLWLGPTHIKTLLVFVKPVSQQTLFSPVVSKQIRFQNSPNKIQPNPPVEVFKPQEESGWCPWYRRSVLCLSNAAIDVDLLTLVVPETANGLSPEEAEEKWCRRRWRCFCSCFQLGSTLPAPPSPPPAACDGAPSSSKISDGTVPLRYCQGFFPAVSLSPRLALNLLTSNRIMFLLPWMAAMWRGVWPHVDLAFMSKVKPTFSTPYLKPQPKRADQCLFELSIFKYICLLCP